MKKTAVAYYRTSSATNVGADKDSLKTKDAVFSFAKSNKTEIVKEYYDASVSGADQSTLEKVLVICLPMSGTEQKPFL